MNERTDKHLQDLNTKIDVFLPVNIPISDLTLLNVHQEHIASLPTNPDEWERWRASARDTIDDLSKYVNPMGLPILIAAMIEEIHNGYTGIGNQAEKVSERG